MDCSSQSNLEAINDGNVVDLFSDISDDETVFDINFTSAASGTEVAATAPDNRAGSGSPVEALSGFGVFHAESVESCHNRPSRGTIQKRKTFHSS